MTQAELTSRILKSLKGGETVTLTIGLPEVIGLCANLQVALRHPHNRGPGAAIARQFIQQICAQLEANGQNEFAAFIRMGNDPANDTPN